MKLPVVGLLALALATNSVLAENGDAVQARITKDVADGAPIVIHLVVSLCDNENQGIVPVARDLGNGQNPGTNLYWGALYGVRTHLIQTANWSRPQAPKPDNKWILDRVVLKTGIDRNNQPVDVFIVADAWDGAHIRTALKEFLEMAAGNKKETVAVGSGARQQNLNAAGMAHMVAFVGHNGLMDFSLSTPSKNTADTLPKSAVVLACASKTYFKTRLESLGAHPLLLTTGLMAPEAYTLDAAIRSWAAGKPASAVRQSAAEAYNRYQKCGENAALRLFWSAP